MGYTVKGIKTFRGMEGEGYNASLYRDGKRVAEVVDDASGGPLMIEWKDRASWRTPVEVVGYEGRKYTVNMSPEEKLLHEHCLTLPALVSDLTDALNPNEKLVMAMTPELFIEQLVNDALMIKDIQRMMRGKVAFIDGDKLYTVKVARGEAETVQHVRSKYPGAKVLNGLQSDELLAAVKAMSK